MKTAAIIVAAGRGTRVGGDLPKQWRALAGRRVIDWTIASFENTPDIAHIVVVLHPDDIEMLTPTPNVTVVAGGATRAASVCNGLEALTSHAIDQVLIHDAARCCINSEHITEIIHKLRLSACPGVAPALPVSDALWHGVDGKVSGTQDREGLYRAQTPQAFDYLAILAAHRVYEGDTAADDVQVARTAGLDIEIVDGLESNLKITYAEDFLRAKKTLKDQMDIRVGSGFDVHRFGPGDHVMLCGVPIPHEQGLQGHSDADVGLHTITDAIYGALAEGDIGQHFPPTDPQWKGAESHIFLRHAVQLAAVKGFKINNIDITMMCERPKIGPHADVMRQKLSDIIGIDVSRISVKATTTERLGFTGREEGIAAQAVTTLVSL
ncbi:bifunctional 2-C-methyl-D-erythritol 4-phosphate cytidylyltransferase/2-C-methyl-D-erythritol 2,4-cyclodiphosphate synthase [Roseovarius sp. EL26]|uniref:bifunctional 2-C-methyl-D-erythritol 4-phosphate cytidylyltransferase/2-C-methyl-D-erythritol 2,4-cyclodiphosphate synthase n=1 Tax=Roseovarius sp. EL26 TaxID=2126672 RepID=UPI000EA3D506|nr:bifunctional 2-C-methyl-D-erythritol 4-phosphate cytidylyltransferase/2-C-methyl-D-erythritol 2,4-cyclodiphosphate synthase [Roseovarius sp. EL26]